MTCWRRLEEWQALQEHSLFLNVLLLEFHEHCLFIAIEHVLEGAVVLGTAQGQRMIAVGHIPPRPQAIEPGMADEFIGGLNPATAQRIAPFALGAIVKREFDVSSITK